jgi:hypothetical protein
VPGSRNCVGLPARGRYRPESEQLPFFRRESSHRYHSMISDRSQSKVALVPLLEITDIFRELY